MWVIGSLMWAAASDESLKFGVQGATATNWFSQVNGARDNGIWLYFTKQEFLPYQCDDLHRPQEVDTFINEVDTFVRHIEGVIGICVVTCTLLNCIAGLPEVKQKTKKIIFRVVY